MDILFQIVTMMFPKAGVQAGGVPLTLNLVLLAAVIVRNPNQTMLAIQKIKPVGYLYAVLLVFGAISLILSVGHWKLFKIAEMITVLASPLAIVFASRMNAEKMLRITCIALILVDLYAVVQFAVGIVSTAVPGLTYTYGQSITSKSLGYGYGSGGADSANKMPSTYTNGNYLGIFDVLGIALMLAWRPLTKWWRASRIIAIVLGAIGLMLCGSRSIVIPFILVCVFLVVQRYRSWPRRMKGTYLAIGLVGLAIIVVYLAVFQSNMINHFFNRIVVQTAGDSTGAGRTVQWEKLGQNMLLLGPLQISRLMFFGQESTYDLGGEGLPEFFATFGAVSTCAFYGMIVAGVVYCMKNKPIQPIAFGVLCSGVAFSVDQSFYYPPTVMQVFMALGIAVAIMERYTSDSANDMNHVMTIRAAQHHGAGERSLTIARV
ncbi:O-antigen ligase family protein [Bifidobacterium aesculapii]|uniref:O-antigen ligase family protein n=1 Tax=Bifidobacterium aesculapii TaxID=1329411 RepID=UPI0006E30723|nr:O-antigen ligase family protein [Bifidobacterium aesculapii]